MGELKLETNTFTDSRGRRSEKRRWSVPDATPPQHADADAQRRQGWQDEVTYDDVDAACT
jgi:hypothetical protein